MKTYTGSFNSLTTSTASFDISDWGSVKGNVNVYINNKDYLYGGKTYRYPLGYENSKGTYIHSDYNYYVSYNIPGSSAIYSLYTSDDLEITSIQNIGGTYYDKPDWVELLDYDFPTSSAASNYPRLSDVTFNVNIELFPCRRD